MVNRKSQFIERFGGIDEQHIRPLSEVCTLITDGTHNPPKFVNEGIPFLLVSNITGDVITYDTTKFITEATYNELIKRTPVEIGDVLLSTVGSYGHPALVEDSTKFSFQRHIALLKPNKTLIGSRFLHTAILAPDAQRQIDELVQGVAQKTLNLSAIKKIHIPVPSMDAQAAFIRFVRQSDKSKFTVGRRFKSQFIERFEGQGYAVVKAKTFMTNMRNGVSPSKKGLHAEKVLTLSAVTQGAFDPEAWKDGIFDECPPADKRIHTSEFYMCRGNGNKMLVGTAVFSPEDHDDLVFPDTVIAAHIDSNIILLPYLFVAWKMPSVRKQIEENARTTNGTYKINQTVLSNIELIVPPLEKQNEFVSFVEQSDKSKLSVQNKLSAFRRLTYRILQFEGGLRNV